MNKDDYFTTVELVEYRREQRISEELSGVAGQQSNAVELEHVERILDFTQAAFGVGQRNGGEHPEPAREVTHQLCPEFIALARSGACGLAIVEPDARTRHRIDGDSHTGLIHLFDCTARRPIR